MVKRVTYNLSSQVNCGSELRADRKAVKFWICEQALHN